MNLDVVVCAKNQARSMDRVLQQIITHVPFKNLIVVYGTSTDETKKIAEKYTSNVFWDENKGLGAARNLGVRKATSEIVAMIDADVILTKEWFQQLITHFKDPKVAAVIGTCIYGYGYKPLEAYYEHLRRTATVNWGCQNTLFRKEAVLKVGNFDDTIKGAGEDYDLYLRLIAAGYKWTWVRKATVWHPMTLTEYLKHMNWWSRGRPFMAEAAEEAKGLSLLRFYACQLSSILVAFSEGLKLATSVHPTFIALWPFMRTSTVLHILAELKKQH
jgi:GT2 family glycosyltransferase